MHAGLAWWVRRGSNPHAAHAAPAPKAGASAIPPLARCQCPTGQGADRARWRLRSTLTHIPVRSLG